MACTCSVQTNIDKYGITDAETIETQTKQKKNQIGDNILKEKTQSNAEKTNS